MIPPKQSRGLEAAVEAAAIDCIALDRDSGRVSPQGADCTLDARNLPSRRVRESLVLAVSALLSVEPSKHLGRRISIIESTASSAEKQRADEEDTKEDGDAPECRGCTHWRWHGRGSEGEESPQERGSGPRPGLPTLPSHSRCRRKRTRACCRSRGASCSGRLPRAASSTA